MKNAIKVLSLVAIIMVCSLLIFATKNEKQVKANDTKVSNDKNTSETYQIKALKIPENLTFAGEHVPIENEDVRERIERE